MAYMGASSLMFKNILGCTSWSRLRECAEGFPESRLRDFKFAQSKPRTSNFGSKNFQGM